MSVTETLERMQQAINSHDIGAMVGCFAHDYRCGIPLHPSRSFVGSDHVRQNWTGLFRRVPDVKARVLRSVDAIANRKAAAKVKAISFGIRLPPGPEATVDA